MPTSRSHMTPSPNFAVRPPPAQAPKEASMPTAEAYAYSTGVVGVRGYTTLRRLLAVTIVALAFSHNLWTGWHRWGDPIIDCGRELDVPRQLLDGKTLYEDVRYWYGPLAPYTNALLYRLFGVHSDVIAIAGWIT